MRKAFAALGLFAALTASQVAAQNYDLYYVLPGEAGSKGIDIRYCCR